MTVSPSAPHVRPARLRPPPGFDSTAQLMQQFTAQLSRQLGTVRPPLAPAPPTGPGPGRPTLVAVAHGSRDPAAGTTLRALLDLVRAAHPELRVELSHLEIDHPRLGDVLAALPPGEAVLVPLLFGRGHHVGHDLPAAVRRAPQLRATVAAPLGPHPLLADALAARLAEACVPAAPAAPYRPDGVVLAAAGSRDPRSAVDAGRTAQLLSARLGGGVPVLPAYASGAGRRIPEALTALRRRGCVRPAVAAYFTAPGVFAASAAGAAAAESVPCAAPLGAHPALARLLLHRYTAALRDRAARF